MYAGADESAVLFASSLSTVAATWLLPWFKRCLPSLELHLTSTGTVSTHQITDGGGREVRVTLGHAVDRVRRAVRVFRVTNWIGRPPVTFSSQFTTAKANGQWPVLPKLQLTRRPGLFSTSAGMLTRTSGPSMTDA